MGSQGEQLVLPQLVETAISLSLTSKILDGILPIRTFKYGGASFLSLVGKKRFANITSDIVLKV